MMRILYAGILFLMVAAAHAHSVVSTTTPEDGAMLEEFPGEIALTFAKPIRLTRVSIKHFDNLPVNLMLGDQNTFLKKFELKAPDLGIGLYQIEWRGLSVDGHVMRGAFTFQVK